MVISGRGGRRIDESAGRAEMIPLLSSSGCVLEVGRAPNDRVFRSRISLRSRIRAKSGSDPVRADHWIKIDTFLLQHESDRDRT